MEFVSLELWYQAELQRTEAALPQIASLNPLVSLTALPTSTPFLRNPSSSTSGADVDSESEVVDFLRREQVDVVVACDMSKSQMVRACCFAYSARASEEYKGSEWLTTPGIYRCSSS